MKDIDDMDAKEAYAACKDDIEELGMKIIESLDGYHPATVMTALSRVLASVAQAVELPNSIVVEGVRLACEGRSDAPKVQ